MPVNVGPQGKNEIELTELQKERTKLAQLLAREQIEQAKQLISTVQSSGGVGPEALVALAQVIATNYNTIVMNAKAVK